MVRKAAVVLALCATFAGCDNRPETVLIDEAHAFILTDLRDPDSAKFNDKGAHAFPELGLVCGGRVNSKNGFGGYTGDQAYYFQRGSGAALGDSEEATALVDACTKAYRALAEKLNAEK